MQSSKQMLPFINLFIFALYEDLCSKSANFEAKFSKKLSWGETAIREGRVHIKEKVIEHLG